MKFKKGDIILDSVEDCVIIGQIVKKLNQDRYEYTVIKELPGKITMWGFKPGDVTGGLTKHMRLYRPYKQILKELL